jgi:hypothetical protein
MFEHRISGENQRKRSEIFFENLRRIQGFDLGKKKLKLSHACVPLTRASVHTLINFLSSWSAANKESLAKVTPKMPCLTKA